MLQIFYFDKKKKQLQDGQTAACTLPQPLALHLIGENDIKNVDKGHLNGYSYICLGGNHQRQVDIV